MMTESTNGSLEQLLVGGAAELGMELDENAVKLYFKYLEYLLQWNEKINLTAITDPSEIVKKHFLDSIAVLPHLQLNSGDTLLDVGTGAGFPGVPVKLARKEISVVLLDSLTKRTFFLKGLLVELGLEGIAVAAGRAEDMARDGKFRGSFDCVTSRAVAELSVLLELCLPFVKDGGIFVAYKGPRVRQEIEEAGAALEILGGEVEREVEIILPCSEEKRTLVFVRKVRATPDKYPRRSGIPEKRPLK